MNTWRKIIFVVKSENNSDKTINSFYHQHEYDDGTRLIACPSFKREEIICPECQEIYSDKNSNCITLEKEVSAYWSKGLLYGKYLYDFNLSEDWHIHSDGSKHKTAKINGEIFCNDCTETFNFKTDFETKAIFYKKHSISTIQEIRYYLLKAAPIWLKLKKDDDEFEYFYIDSNREEIIDAMMQEEVIDTVTRKYLISIKNNEQEDSDFIFEITKKISPQIFSKVNTLKKNIDKKTENDPTKTMPYNMNLIIMNEFKKDIDGEKKGKGNKKKEKTLLIIAEPAEENTGISFKQGRKRKESGTQKFESGVTNQGERISLNTEDYEVVTKTNPDLEEELKRESTLEMSPITNGPIIPILPPKKTKEQIEESSDEEIPVDVKTSDPISEEEDSSDYKTVEVQPLEETEEDSNEFISEETATLDPENLSTEIINENFIGFNESMKELEKEIVDEGDDTVDEEDFAGKVMEIVSRYLEDALKDISAARQTTKVMFEKLVDIHVPEERLFLLENWEREIENTRNEILENSNEILAAFQELLEKANENQEKSIEFLGITLEEMLSAEEDRRTENTSIFINHLSNFENDFQENLDKVLTESKEILQKGKSDQEKAIALLGETLEEMASAESNRILKMEKDFQEQLEKTISEAKKSVEAKTDDMLAENGIVIGNRIGELSNKISRLQEEAKSWHDNSLKKIKAEIEAIRLALIKEQSDSQKAFKEHLETKTDESTETIKKAREKSCQSIEDAEKNGRETIEKNTARSCEKVRRAAPFLIIFFILIALIGGALMFSLYWTTREEIKTLKAERQEIKKSLEKNQKLSKDLTDMLKQQIIEQKFLAEEAKKQKKSFAKLEKLHKENMQKLEESAEDQKRQWYFFRDNANTEWLKTKKLQEKDFSNTVFKWENILDYYWEEIEKNLKNQVNLCIPKKIQEKAIPKISNPEIKKLAKDKKKLPPKIDKPVKKRKKLVKAKSRRDNPPPLLIMEYDEDGKEIVKKK